MNTLTEKQLMPLRSPDFEGSTLSDLLAIRSRQEREHEAIVAARIDTAFKEWRDTLGVSESSEFRFNMKNEELLKVFLREHLS